MGVFGDPGNNKVIVLKRNVKVDSNLKIFRLDNNNIEDFHSMHASGISVELTPKLPKAPQSQSC